MSEGPPKPISKIEDNERANRKEIAALTTEIIRGGTPSESPEVESPEVLKEKQRRSLEINKETRRMEIIYSAMALAESQETFPFPGIDPEAYVKMKADEEEYPGYTTPIDELIERFKNEGMIVVLGHNPRSGNVYILPAQSTNIEMDSISPKQLQLSDRMNEQLKALILLMRG